MKDGVKDGVKDGERDNCSPQFMLAYWSKGETTISFARSGNLLIWNES